MIIVKRAVGIGVITIAVGLIVYFGFVGYMPASTQTRTDITASVANR